MSSESARTPTIKLDQVGLNAILKANDSYVAGRQGGKRAHLVMHEMAGLDLNDRDLSNIDMTGAKLRGASMQGVKLTNSQLFAADLTMIRKSVGAT